MTLREPVVPEHRVVAGRFDEGLECACGWEPDRDWIHDDLASEEAQIKGHIKRTAKVATYLSQTPQTTLLKENPHD